MTERILGPTDSRRRRRFLLVPVLLVAAAALLLVGVAQAVHDEDFQLDGNIAASSTTNNGGHTQHFDWDSFFNAQGQRSPVLPDASRPGFTASVFQLDFALKANGDYDTGDSTTYTQGSKDIDNVSSWVCTAAQNVTSKGDIQNAYALAYTDPVSNHQFLYFAQERNSNNGDANVAFWFLQDPTANCSAENGTTNWTGNHRDGDLFVVSAFTNGGVVSTINAFRWNGGANGALGTSPVASGGDCTSTPPPALGDPACAVVNKQNLTDIPWLTNNNGKTNGLGHTLLTAEFFEGGVDLTQAGLSGKCFNTFVADTRSSQSFTATLFDFARGQLGECLSETKTTPQTGDGGTIPAGGLSIGTGSVTVRDHAEVKVTGSDTFGGDVTFFLCGPLALNSTSNCESGGVQIGAPVPVSNPSPATANSAVATLTSVGRYCWRAVYSGSGDVPGSRDPPAGDTTSTTECFMVNPVTPTLTTQASADTTFGQPISDTATLSGTANAPGTNGIGPGGTINATNGAPANGTISWTAFGPNDCTTVVFGPTTRIVSGDGTYPTAAQTPISFTPGSVGTFTFVASYSGDSPNTNGAGPSPCPDPSGAENVKVTDTSSVATHQTWLPNDSATVSTTGGSPVSGTLTIALFESADCTGTAVTGQTYTFTLTNVASPVTRSTSNSTYFVETDKTVSWKSTFVSSNPDVSSPAAPTCEVSTVDLTPNQ